MMVRMWKTGNPHVLLMGVKTGTTTVEIRFFKNTEIDLSYNPTIPLLGIYPKAFISYRDTSSPHVYSFSIQ